MTVRIVRSARVRLALLIGVVVETTLALSTVGAQEPLPRAVTAEAPIVANNSASAKKRAMDDAFHLAVERAFVALLPDLGIANAGAMPPGLTRLRGMFLTRAQQFVRSYRVLEQDETGGRVRVVVDAEINENFLRREMERACGECGASVPAAAGRLARVLVAGAGASDACLAVTRALAVSGIRTDVPPVGATDEAKLRDIAARSGASALVLVSATVLPEGPVRGTAKVAVDCSVNMRVQPLTGAAGADEQTRTRGFAETEDAARAACLASAAAEAVRKAAATIAAASGGTSGEARVTLVLNLVEPATLGPVLQALRRVGGVSSSEVRRISVGRAEIRVITRLTPTALGAALVRALGTQVSAQMLEALGDRVVFQVRMPQPVPGLLPVGP